MKITNPVSGGSSSLTLTTVGSGGASTLVGNTLNIPVYVAGSGTGNVNNGGNSYGTTMVLGTVDNNYLEFTVNNNIFHYAYPNSDYPSYPYLAWGSQPQVSTTQTNQYFYFSKSKQIKCLQHIKNMFTSI